MALKELENLNDLEGKEHFNTLYALIMDPPKVKQLDDRIILHLEPYGDTYGIPELMKRLILYSNEELSKKTFEAIPYIVEDIELRALTYALLVKENKEKFWNAIYEVIKEEANDYLTSEVIIKCAYATEDLQIAKAYTLIKDKELKEATLARISLIPWKGERWDELRKYAWEQYLLCKGEEIVR